MSGPRFLVKFRYHGAHVWLRIFQADGPGQTWQKNGDLILSPDAWAAFCSELGKTTIEVVPDEA